MTEASSVRSSFGRTVVPGLAAAGLLTWAAHRPFARLEGQEAAMAEAVLGTAGGEVDIRCDHTRHALQHLLDAADARGAAHALDVELQAVAPHLVASLRHRLDQRRQGHRGGRGHGGDLGRQVDARRLHALDLHQGALDMRHARGAGHAGDVQCA